MKSNEKITGEGKINLIPKTIKVSKRMLPNNNTPSKYKIVLNKYFKAKREQNLNEIKINKPMNTIEINKHRVKLKRTESNSTTSVNTNTEKIKRVTFSTVEIIRTQNFKQFNRLNSYKYDEIKIEKNSWSLTDNCGIF